MAASQGGSGGSGAPEERAAPDRAASPGASHAGSGLGALPAAQPADEPTLKVEGMTAGKAEPGDAAPSRASGAASAEILAHQAMITERTNQLREEFLASRQLRQSAGLRASPDPEAKSVVGLVPDSDSGGSSRSVSHQDLYTETLARLERDHGLAGLVATFGGAPFSSSAANSAFRPLPSWMTPSSMPAAASSPFWTLAPHAPQETTAGPPDGVATRRLRKLSIGGRAAGGDQVPLTNFTDDKRPGKPSYFSRAADVSAVAEEVKLAFQKAAGEATNLDIKVTVAATGYLNVHVRDLNESEAAAARAAGADADGGAKRPMLESGCYFSVSITDASLIPNAPGKFFVHFAFELGDDLLYQVALEEAKFVDGRAVAARREARLKGTDVLAKIMSGTLPATPPNACIGCTMPFAECACMDAEFNNLKECVLRAIAVSNPPLPSDSQDIFTLNEAHRVFAHLLACGKKDKAFRARLRRVDFPKAVDGVNTHWDAHLQAGLKSLTVMLDEKPH